MVLNSKVVVRDSGIAGKGLVATAPIAAGEVIWHADAGDAERYFFPKEVVESWPEDERKFFMNFAYVVSPGIWSGVRREDEHLTDRSQYMNHCCAPNTAFRGDEEMVAVVDIAAGRCVHGQGEAGRVRLLLVHFRRVCPACQLLSPAAR